MGSRLAAVQGATQTPPSPPALQCWSRSTHSHGTLLTRPRAGSFPASQRARLSFPLLSVAAKHRDALPLPADPRDPGPRRCPARARTSTRRSPARRHTCFVLSLQRPASLRQLPPVPYGSRSALAAPFLALPAETCRENWGSCCSYFQETVCSASQPMAFVPGAQRHTAGLALVHASGCWH